MRRLLSCLLLLPLLAACGNSKESQEADKAVIEDMLVEYLPHLGLAYAEGKLLALKPWAADKEIARIKLRREELAARGIRYVPELKSVTIEEVDVFSYGNAFVTTLEIWDLRQHATGSDQVMNEALAQSNRVKYQLKRDHGRWLVLYRSIGDP